MTTSVLELLTGKARARQATADDTLVAAAKRAANGESVDVDAVDAALVATGRTPADFAAMVATATKRRAWFRDMDKGTAAKAAADKAGATYAREEAAFVVVRDAWVARSQTLGAERDQAMAVVARARDARQALVHPDNAPTPALAQRLRDAQDAVTAAEVELSRIRRDVRDTEDRQKAALDWKEGRNWKPDADAVAKATADENQLVAERCARRLKDLAVELAAANEALAKATAELDAAEAAALKT